MLTVPQKMIYSLILLIFLYLSNSFAQNSDILIDTIYQRVLTQESQLDSLGGYSYMQLIKFKKLDGSGEVDEQSEREFLVSVQSINKRHRELISARDYKDGKWIEITDEEKHKKHKPESQSQKFSLLEMVSPEKRKLYRFKRMGREKLGVFNTVHLFVEPIESDEEKFAGDLWFENADYNLVRAKLIPSENPTGLESMQMTFDMRPYEKVWLPKTITFDAQISFLFFFKGSVYSEIEFSDYQFNLTFPDSLF